MLNNVQKLAASLLPLLVLIIGCGEREQTKPEQLVLVDGKLTIGREVLSKTLVMFVPESDGSRARGTTNENGEFHLETEGGFDGIPPGSYTVLVRYVTIKNRKIEPDARLKPFEDPQSSPIQVVVDDDTSNIHIDLEPHLE